ncbi:hypothetical protein ScPMuIL_012805 [Solemya velum]
MLSGHYIRTNHNSSEQNSVVRTVTDCNDIDAMVSLKLGITWAKHKKKRTKMKVSTPEISWHERDPVYSVDFQPGVHNINRLATAGVDKLVRIWQVIAGEDGKAKVEFLANLRRHSKAVNVCRFSPDGEQLASAGDDSVIVFWKLNESTLPANNIFQEEDEENKENWVAGRMLRGHLEDIYDLCWSSDGKHMISGSVDNSAILWDLSKDQKLAVLNEHKSFVQGVAWDPQGEFAATLSTDRSCRIYNVHTKSCMHNVSKMVLPSQSTDTEVKPKSFRMFHDDTMRSFFRRLSFSPNGELLLVPSGCVEQGDKVTNTTYIFTRNCLSKPAMYLPSPDKVTIAVRCCPQLFHLRQSTETDQENNNLKDQKEWERCSTVFSLPYRVVFAVATEDSILLYDTQQKSPIAYIGNIHYHQLSDLTWSSNGQYLIVSSTDGYVSMVTFEEGELGTPYKPEIQTDTEEKLQKNPQPDQNNSEKILKNGDPLEGGSDKHVAMETDTSTSDLHLVLEMSDDNLSEKPNSSVTETDQKPNTSAVRTDATTKPAPLNFRSSSGQPRRIQLTTLSLIKPK